MMEILTTFLVIILLIFVCRGLSKFFFRTARHLEEKDIKERYLKQELLTAVGQIRDSTAREEEPVIDPRERLLNAHRELINKQQLNYAMEKELGIRTNEN